MREAEDQYMALDSDPEWQQSLSSDPEEQSNEDWLEDYNQQEVQEMPLIAKDTGGKDFEKLEAGTHIAVCDMVVHLGLQPSKNPKYKDKDTIYVRWEVPSERLKWEKDGVEHEGPMVIGNFYTNSLSPKSYLRKDLEGWRAKAFTEDELQGFDVMNILGKACMITVVHSEDGKYANVTAVSSLPKGTTAPEAEQDLIGYCEGQEEQWDKLPEWLQNKIKEQVHPEEAATQESKPDFDDSIPF